MKKLLLPIILLGALTFGCHQEKEEPASYNRPFNADSYERNFRSHVFAACMNEGRISSSVFVCEGCDIGGVASILGVLSGGTSDPISIGKNCLLGVNSSTGISLGDGCIVDGGIAVLAGTIFEISKAEAEKIAQINTDFSIHPNGLYKGRDLSGKHGIHFRQDSNTGKMIAFRSNRKIELNAALH